jgi:hypothetical protein
MSQFTDIISSNIEKDYAKSNNEINLSQHIVHKELFSEEQSSKKNTCDRCNKTLSNSNTLKSGNIYECFSCYYSILSDGLKNDDEQYNEQYDEQYNEQYDEQYNEQYDKEYYRSIVENCNKDIDKLSKKIRVSTSKLLLNYEDPKKFLNKKITPKVQAEYSSIIHELREVAKHYLG